jgi:osmotically-inducible protein OsmY
MARLPERRSHARAWLRLAAALLCGALAAPLVGCGGDDEEERLEELSKELSSLRAGLAERRELVNEREATAKAAQDELAEARGKLLESEQRIAEIEKEIGAHASDPLIFRMVQKALLDDDDLEDVAISARVERGVVSLSGVVPEAKLRDRAVKVAQDVPGVVSVQNRIQVAGGEPKPG